METPTSVSPEPPAFQPRWRDILALCDDDPIAGRVRAEQLGEIARSVPFGGGALLMLAVMVTAIFRHSPAFHGLLLWLAFMTGTLGYGLRQARMRRVHARETLPARAALAVAARALAIGAMWAAIFPALVSACDSHQRAALAGLHIAMISAGAFVFAGVPIAAFAFVGALIASLLLVMTMTGAPVSSFALVGIIGAMIARGVIAHARTIVSHVHAHERLRKRGDMIGMLLSEYERAGADWLWETDAEGRCTHLSPRFAEVIGQPVTHFLGHQIFDPERSQALNKDELATAIRARQTFRNIQVGPVVDRDQRWWSLSGTPRFDARGHFAGFTGVGSDVTEQRRAREQIERMATHDGLTGLANRAAIRGHIQAALDTARGGGGSAGCAVMMIDLDRFKGVNDTLGHHMGDELLREVARRLQASLRHGGAVARLGGDEFAVVLSGINPPTARAVAARIVDTLSEGYSIKGSAIRIGASVGIAIGPADGETIDDILRAADLALYRAKGDGRGVVRLYEPALHNDAEERRALETALRVALREDQFSLMFQPICDLGHGAVVGFEALLRWKHPVLGQVSPAKFIPIAEDLGLMDTIGEWVLRTACAWASRWPRHIGISVNLSPSQLINPRLPGLVLNALATHGVSPDRLELEVTESIFLNEDNNTRGALDQLSRLGVRIGLDDFGTGYSSLGYLRTTIFNTIKIDRCFVRDAIDGASQSAAIVRHIVGLAASLGMETVAEGAETIEEMNAVRDLGCGLVQGYFTGRPMAAEDALALVASLSMEARAA